MVNIQRSKGFLVLSINGLMKYIFFSAIIVIFDNFMFEKFFSCNFFGDLQLLFLFELNYSFFDQFVFLLFVIFPALSNGFPDLIEPSNDVLCNLEL